MEMGKTYIDTIKYMVKGEIEIDGIVDKPDIVGAVFGQTEGLLGDELDLRELLKAGKIGRIEVDTNVTNGKTVGKIAMPSSLDKAETAMIAAALETVDRVGPCNAKITVNDIEDTRSVKREFVMGRAKELLGRLGETKETKELALEIRGGVREAALMEYGRDRLAAGPDIDLSNDIIVVEGRADVLNLLRYGIRNVIAMQGAIVPRTIEELSKRKEVTLFVDGDRGGDMAAAALARVGHIAFMAKAPDGKEVEELTQKEILACLKHRMPFGEERHGRGDRRPPRPPAPNREFHEPEARGEGGRFEHHPPSGAPTEPQAPTEGGRFERRAPREGGGRFERRERGERGGRDRRGGRGRERGGGGRERFERRDYAPPREATPEAFRSVYDSIKDSMKAILLDGNGAEVRNVPVAEMIIAIKENKCASVVFDGIVTQRLVDLADAQGVSTLVGLKEGKIENKKRVKVFTMA
jgi:DNA primase